MKFSDLVERPAGDVILQMFTTSGTNENGSNYNVNVVDVYTIRDEKNQPQIHILEEHHAVSHAAVQEPHVDFFR